MKYLDKDGLTALWTKIKEIVPTRTSQLTHDSGFLCAETDPTVPEYVKSISAEKIAEWTASEVKFLDGDVVYLDTLADGLYQTTAAMYQCEAGSSNPQELFNDHNRAYLIIKENTSAPIQPTYYVTFISGMSAFKLYYSAGNKTVTNLHDNSSAEIDNPVGRMIWLTKTSSQVVAANTQTTIIYDKESYNDSQGAFVHTNGGIKIGPNVRKVLVEGQYRDTGERGKYVYVLKNGERYACATSYPSTVNYGTVVEVQENDLIQFACYNNQAMTVQGVLSDDGKFWDYLKAVIIEGPDEPIVKKINIENTQFAMDALPIGAMTPYGNTTPPDNWLICDGSAISRADYQELFAVIGTSYGIGNGTTTFNLPNKKGKVSVGLDTSDSNFNIIGKKGGEKEHTLTINEMPSHKHDLTGYYPHVNGLNAPTGNNASGTGGILSYNCIQSTGGDQPHNNLQPYEVDIWVIKAKKSVVALSTNVIDTLTSTSTTDALSAKQGKVLNDKINSFESGDTLPINAIVHYDGETVPEGYELVADYSYNEIKTGETWVDGKPIYKKVRECGAMSGADLYVPCGVSNVDKIWIDQSSSFIISADGAVVTIPFHNAHNANYSIECYITNAKQIQFYSPNQRFSNAFVTLRYTKTTD